MIGVTGLLRILAPGYKHVEHPVDAIGVHRFPVRLVGTNYVLPVSAHVTYGSTVKLERIIALKFSKRNAASLNVAKAGPVIVSRVEIPVVRPGRCPFIARAVGDLEEIGVKPNIDDGFAFSSEQDRRDGEYKDEQVQPKNLLADTPGPATRVARWRMHPKTSSNQHYRRRV